MSFFYPFDTLLRISDFPSDVWDVELPSGRRGDAQGQLTAGNEKSRTVTRGFPKMDLIDGKDKLTCVVELPGLKKEDISIALHDNVLSISGKVEHASESTDEGASYKFKERTFGSFERKLAVPPNLKESEISASLVDGLLKVSFPKHGKETEAKKISIA